MKSLSKLFISLFLLLLIVSCDKDTKEDCNNYNFVYVSLLLFLLCAYTPKLHGGWMPVRKRQKACHITQWVLFMTFMV